MWSITALLVLVALSSIHANPQSDNLGPISKYEAGRNRLANQIIAAYLYRRSLDGIGGGNLNGRDLDGIGGGNLNGRSLTDFDIIEAYLNSRSLDGIGGGNLNGRDLDGIGGGNLNGRSLDGIGGGNLNGRSLDGIGGGNLNGRSLDGIGGGNLNGRSLDGIGGGNLNGRDLDGIGGGNLNGRDLDGIGGGNLNGKRTIKAPHKWRLHDITSIYPYAALEDLLMGRKQGRSFDVLKLGGGYGFAKRFSPQSSKTEKHRRGPLNGLIPGGAFGRAARSNRQDDFLDALLKSRKPSSVSFDAENVSDSAFSEKSAPEKAPNIDVYNPQQLYKATFDIK